jgi:hypothetical protein
MLSLQKCLNDSTDRDSTLWSSQRLDTAEISDVARRAPRHDRHLSAPACLDVRVPAVVPINPDPRPVLRENRREVLVSPTTGEDGMCGPYAIAEAHAAVPDRQAVFASGRRAMPGASNSRIGHSHPKRSAKLVRLLDCRPLQRATAPQLRRRRSDRG